MTEIDSKNYYQTLIADLISRDFPIDDSEQIDELAAGLEDASIGEWLWERILSVSEGVMAPSARRQLGISIFELLAEEPIHRFWKRSLLYLISTPSLRWTVLEAYLNDPIKLYEHFTAVCELQE